MCSYKFQYLNVAHYQVSDSVSLQVKLRGSLPNCTHCGENSVFTEQDFQKFDYENFTQSPMSDKVTWMHAVHIISRMILNFCCLIYYYIYCRQHRVWICSPRMPESLVEITKDWLIMVYHICYWTYDPRITSKSLQFLRLWTSPSPCWKRSCPHLKAHWRKREQHQHQVKSLHWLSCAEGATTLREPSSSSARRGLPLRRISSVGCRHGDKMLILISPCTSEMDAEFSHSRSNLYIVLSLWQWVWEDCFPHS